MSLQSYPMLSVVTNSNNESEPIVASSSQLNDIRNNQPMAHRDGSWVKVEDGSPFLPVSYSFDSLSLAPADNHNHHISFPIETSQLIETSRPFRSPALQPVHLPSSLVSAPTLTSNFKHPPHQYSSGNGVPYHQLSSSSHDNSTVTISQNGHSSPTNSSSAPYQHVSINTISNGPRTSHPVFHTTSALAAHHGIPQSLPPVPRTTRYQSTSASTSPSNDFDFNNLCSNYLSMLSQKPEDNQSQNMSAAPNTTSNDSNASAAQAEDARAVQALMEVIQGDLHPLSAVLVSSLIPDDSNPRTGSPEFAFFTSPMEDSPFEDFLSTPAVGTNDDLVSEYLTSPAIADSDDFGGMYGLPLFDMDGPAFNPLKESAPSVAQPNLAFNLDGLLQMPSPNTPSLDPTSLHPSPRSSTIPPPADNSLASRRKSVPNGTRKNITPESLVPFDAPIQPRKYVTPSATSRKEVPAVFQRKRARSQAFEDEEGEPALNDLDAIEAKRRQNTLAARRSRKRKLEYQKELEDGIERERVEKEFWRTRSATLEVLLQSHGIEVPLPQPS